MAKGKNQDESLVKVLLATDEANIKQVADAVTTQFSNSLATGLTNGLNKAIGDFAKTLGKSVQITFNDTVFSELKKPIEIELNTDKAKTKINTLLAPLQKLLDGIASAGNKTSGGGKSSLSLDEQNDKKLKLSTEIKKTTSDVGGVSVNKAKLEAEVKKITDEFKKINAIEINDKNLLSGAQIKELDKLFDRLKAIEVEIKRIETVSENVKEFKLTSRAELDTVEKKLHDLVELIRNAGNDEVFVEEQTKKLFKQLELLRKIDTRIDLLPEEKGEKAIKLIGRFKDVFDDLIAGGVTLAKKDLISPVKLKEELDARKKAEKEAEEEAIRRRLSSSELAKVPTTAKDTRSEDQIRASKEANDLSIANFKEQARLRKEAQAEQEAQDKLAAKSKNQRSIDDAKQAKADKQAKHQALLDDLKDREKQAAAIFKVRQAERDVERVNKKGSVVSDSEVIVLEAYRKQIQVTIGALNKFELSEETTNNLTSKFKTTIKSVAEEFDILRAELNRTAPDADKVQASLNKIATAGSKFNAQNSVLRNNTNGILTDALNKQTAQSAANQSKDLKLEQINPEGIERSRKAIRDYEKELDNFRTKTAEAGVPLIDVVKKTSAFENALSGAKVSFKRLQDQIENGDLTEKEANNKFRAINETLAKTKIAIDQIDGDKLLKDFNSDQLDRFSKGLVTNLAVLGFTLQRIGGELQNFGQTVFQTLGQLATASQPIEQTQNIIQKNFVETGKLTNDQAKELVHNLQDLADLPGNTLKNATEEFNRLADALGNVDDAFDLTKGLSAVAANTGVDNTKEISEILLQARTKPQQFNNDNFGRIKSSGGSNTEKAFVDAGITSVEIANQVGATKVIKVLTQALKDIEPPQLTTADRFNVLSNRVADLGKGVGTVLLPALDQLNKFLKSFTRETLEPLEDRFKALPEGTKNLVSQLALGIPVLALVSGALISLGGALSFVGSGFLQLKNLGALAKNSLGLGIIAEEATAATTALNNLGNAVNTVSTTPPLVSKFATSTSRIAQEPFLRNALPNQETSLVLAKTGLANAKIAGQLPSVEVATYTKEVYKLETSIARLKTTLASLPTGSGKSNLLANILPQREVQLQATKSLLEQARYVASNATEISKYSKEVFKLEESLSRLRGSLSVLDLAKESSFIGRGLQSLEAGATSVRNFVNELKTIPNAVKGGFTVLIDSIKSFPALFSEGLVSIRGGLTGVTAVFKEFGVFKTLLGGTVGSITALTSGFTSLGGTVLEVLGFTNPIGIAINIILSLFTALYSNIDGIRDRVVVTFGNLNIAINRVLKLLGLEEGGLLAVLGYIGDAFNLVFGSIGVVILDVVDALAGSIGDILNNVANIVEYFKSGQILNGFAEIGKLVYNITAGFFDRLAKELAISVGDAIASIIEKIPGGGELAKKIRAATNELGKGLGFDKEAVDANKKKTAEITEQKKAIEKANLALVQQKGIIKDISAVLNKVNENFAKVATNRALRQSQENAAELNFNIDKTLEDDIKAGAISSEAEITKRVNEGTNAQIIASNKAFENKKEDVKRQAEELYKTIGFVISKQGSNPDIIRNFQQSIINAIGSIKAGDFNKAKVFIEAATALQTDFSNAIDKDSEGAGQKYDDYIASYNQLKDLTSQATSLLIEQDNTVSGIEKDRQKRIRENIKQFQDNQEQYKAIIATTPIKKELESLNDEIARQQTLVDDFTSGGDIPASETAQNRLNKLKERQVELEEKIKASLRFEKDYIKNAQDAQDASVAKDKVKNEIARQHLEIIEKVAEKNREIFQTGIDGLSGFIDKLRETNSISSTITENFVKGLNNFAETTASIDSSLREVHNSAIENQIKNAQKQIRLTNKELFVRPQLIEEGIEQAPSIGGLPAIKRPDIVDAPKPALSALSGLESSGYIAQIQSVAKQVDSLVESLKYGSSEFSKNAINLGRLIGTQLEALNTKITESDEIINDLRLKRNDATSDTERKALTDSLNTEKEKRANLLSVAKVLSQEEQVVNNTIVERTRRLADEATQRQKNLDLAIAILDNENKLLQSEIDFNEQRIANTNRRAELGEGLDVRGIEFSRNEAIKERAKLLENEYQKELKILQAKRVSTIIDATEKGLTQDKIDLLVAQIDKEIELLGLKNNTNKEGIRLDQKEADASKSTNSTVKIANGISIIKSSLDDVNNSAKNAGKSILDLYSRLASGEGVINDFAAFIGGADFSLANLGETFSDVAQFSVAAFGQALGQTLTETLLNGGKFLHNLGKFFGDILISMGQQLISMGSIATAIGLLALIPFFSFLDPDHKSLIVGPVAIAAGVAAILAGKAIGGGGPTSAEAAKSSNTNASNSANSSAGNSGQVDYNPLKDPKLIYQKGLKQEIALFVKSDDSHIIKAVINGVNRDPKFNDIIGNRSTGFIL